MTKREKEKELVVFLLARQLGSEDLARFFVNLPRIVVRDGRFVCEAPHE